MGKRGVILTKENVIDYGGMGAVSALIWYDQGFDEVSIFNRTSLLFFVCIFFGFNAMFVSVVQFPADRPLLDKERQSGMYPLAAFALANHLACFTMFLCWPTLFTLEVYWLTNLNDAAASFFGFYLVVIITCMVSYVFGMVFGGWFQDLSLALTLIGDECLFKHASECKVLVIAGTYMLTSFLAGGFMVEDVP